jgi:hypothetical protein
MNDDANKVGNACQISGPRATALGSLLGPWKCRGAVLRLQTSHNGAKYSHRALKRPEWCIKMRLSERMHRDRRFIVAPAGLGWRIHIAFSAL